MARIAGAVLAALPAAPVRGAGSVHSRRSIASNDPAPSVGRGEAVCTAAGAKAGHVYRVVVTVEGEKASFTFRVP